METLHEYCKKVKSVGCIQNTVGVAYKLPVAVATAVPAGFSR